MGEGVVRGWGRGRLWRGEGEGNWGWEGGGEEGHWG